MIQIDMEMPTNCYNCWIRQNMGCRIANDSGWLNNRRDDKCPLKEQKRAYWVEETDREYHWHCSNCGTVQGITSVMMKYCPECGCAMEEHPWAASGCGQAFCPGKDE